MGSDFDGVARKLELQESYVSDLVGEIYASGFFESNEYYENPHILDGSTKILEVTIGRQRHTVRMLNYIPKHLSNLLSMIESPVVKDEMR